MRIFAKKWPGLKEILKNNNETKECRSEKKMAELGFSRPFFNFKMNWFFWKLISFDNIGLVGKI